MLRFCQYQWPKKGWHDPFLGVAIPSKNPIFAVKIPLVAGRGKSHPQIVIDIRMIDLFGVLVTSGQIIGLHPKR